MYGLALMQSLSNLKENINKMIDFVVCMMIFLIKIRQMFIQFLNRPQAIL